MTRKEARNESIRPALRIKVRIGDTVVGPGKIRLLRMIDENGGISGAARAMGMSYRRAWHLLNTLAEAFAEPLVETEVGGPGGGGARLTRVGRQIIGDYEKAVAAAEKAARPALDRLPVAAGRQGKTS